MLTRLGRYADRVLELGWLAALVFVPLYFNVYTSRVFEPDKISTFRSLMVIMLVAWLVKMLEGGIRAARSEGLPSRGGRVVAAVDGAAKSGLPSWLGFLRVPMILPILVYAVAYMVSTIFTVTPDATWWGSYQRLQGTYSQYSYMLLGLIVIANLRTRAQLERLITFMVLTSVPVTLYGLAQWARMDPLPWAGDTSTRVASTMGNAIFVAAWLIMVVPLATYKLFTWLNSGRSASAADTEVVSAPVPRRRVVEAPTADYGWAVVANSAGILIMQVLVFYMALKMMAGLPYPDARTWWVLPLALALFFGGCWLIERVGRRPDDPLQTSLNMPAIGAGLFFVSLLALPLTWSIDRTDTSNLTLQIGFEMPNMMWVLFVAALWAAITFLAYSFANPSRTWMIASAALWALVGFTAYVLSGVIIWEVFFILLWAALTAGMRAFSAGHSAHSSPVISYALCVAYVVLIFLQLFCIYLTQSRGPWLGLGVGLVVFAVSMWLVGRTRQVGWMRRLGGAVTAIVAALLLFVAALNIPSSPLKALDSVPVLGRGIERLSTLTQTEAGTGKVRTLIWKGAADLILSNPVRSIIGWGPEAMYVAYNKFYPPELAQVELRNATPDRSHNVEFDQLVTLGLVGLMAYYFMVGAFFFFGIRALKRTRGTRDQLLIIALMSAMAAHFVEIQTGIQIAATWTYFYLFIGVLVVFGYYIEGTLRAAPAYDVTTDLEQARSTPDESMDEELEVVPVSRAPQVGALASAGTSTTSRTRARASTANPPQSKRNGGAMTEAKRRQAAQNAAALRTGAPGAWVRNPAMLAVYVLALVAALVFTWIVNVGTVRADTLYKQGQAWDSNQRWYESIIFYQQAINTQPNQDYYYLFLGRAWLEFAKQVDREQVNFRTSTDQRSVPYATDQDRTTEKLLRLQQSEAVLKRAQVLNPLNTDHYANLGRLYLYWADPTGAQDPSKSQLAVDYMKEATERTPGNAQLRDELGVAYARNGQFTEAVNTLQFSGTKLDPTFARTPFILGQLYQERALRVKTALAEKSELPPGGETDYGKLVLEAGRAYSDTIGVDISQFMDSNFPTRIDFLLDAAQPFSSTNTTLDPATVSNVLTTTVMATLEGQLPLRESEVARVLRARSAYTASENTVPGDLLTKLWNDPAWAQAPAGGSKGWVDADMTAVTRNAMLAYTGLGYIYSRVDRRPEALKAYDRSVLINATATQEQVAGQVSLLESNVADYLRGRSIITDTAATTVPDALLQSLIKVPAWASENRWTDVQLAPLGNEAAVLNADLGYIYSKMGDTAKARASYNRARLLSPSDTWIRDEQTRMGATGP
ncbi:MAG TPA: O-antigen ligase family protein [Chloroflexia bacterium]|nr:O-antigen ligase family protein [Chloroflexia bacterium]